MILLEGSPRILGAFVPKQSEQAREQLERLGVDVRTESKVTAIDAEGVTYDSASGGGSERIAARTVIWAAGVAGSPLGAELARGSGADARPRRPRRRRARPEPARPSRDLGDRRPRRRAQPRPERDDAGARRQPGRQADGPHGRGQHRCAGSRGEATLAFRYRDYGNLATVGRKAAVVELAVPGFGALRFSGLAAWLFWLFAHIYFLIGFRNRLMVMVDWAWAYFTYERGARVVAEPASSPPPPPRF